MKRLLTATWLLSVILLLVACGGKDKSASDSDSAAGADPFELPVDSLPASSLTLDSAGVRTDAGTLVAAIGTPVKNIPDSVGGVYDNVTRDRGPEADEYRFMLGDEYLFTALDFGSGLIDMIMVNGASVAAIAPDGTRVTLASSFSEVLALPGISAEWGGLDDTGTWYWNAAGLWFAPDQSHLPQGLSQKLYNEETMPEPSDFDGSVRVGYIGTGIPF